MDLLMLSTAAMGRPINKRGNGIHKYIDIYKQAIFMFQHIVLLTMYVCFCVRASVLCEPNQSIESSISIPLAKFVSVNWRAAPAVCEAIDWKYLYWTKQAIKKKIWTITRKWGSINLFSENTNRKTPTRTETTAKNCWLMNVGCIEKEITTES